MSVHEAYQLFIERLHKHAQTPPPRHFGNDLLKHPLSSCSEIPSTFSIRDRHGLFPARILVQGVKGKFWLNGLITRITLKKKSINLIMHDWSGSSKWNIDLEDLLELEIYQPLDGTHFTIEDEKLVVKKFKSNSQTEGDPRVQRSAANKHRLSKPIEPPAVQLPYC